MACKLKVDELSKRGDSAIHKDSVPDAGDSNSGCLKTTKDTKLTNKGLGVLDQYIPDQIKSNYHVVEMINYSMVRYNKKYLKQMYDEIIDATLNQTNVGDNNNKFYIIQALASDEGYRYMVYTRWGRVGVKGRVKLHGPHMHVFEAIRKFEDKFYAKTNNHCSERRDFVSYPNYYTWVEMDYEAAAGGQNVHRETKLEERIAKFVNLICNLSMMKEQMMEIGYNAENLPLGKLSKATISKGYEVLKRVADAIDRNNSIKLEQLSGEFYSIIPHDFGFKKMSEFVIDTPEKLKSKLEMVEALGEIEVATKLLGDNAEEDPLLSLYERLGCELTPVEVDSKEFDMINKYMKNTHSKTFKL